jgi:hypothetical protein
MNEKWVIAVGSAVGAGAAAMSGTFGMLAEATGQAGWTLAFGVSIAIGAAAGAFLAVLKPSSTV